MLENPIILAALICFLLGLVLSGLSRVVPGSTIASAVLPIIFLASYVLTYQLVRPIERRGHVRVAIELRLLRTTIRVVDAALAASLTRMSRLQCRNKATRASIERLSVATTRRDQASRDCEPDRRTPLRSRYR